MPVGLINDNCIGVAEVVLAKGVAEEKRRPSGTSTGFEKTELSCNCEHEVHVAAATRGQVTWSPSRATTIRRTANI